MEENYKITFSVKKIKGELRYELESIKIVKKIRVIV